MARSKLALIIALLAAVPGVAAIVAGDDAQGDRRASHSKAHPGWRMIGHDPANTRSQPFEHRIRPQTAKHLDLKWVATTTGDVSGTPAVAHGAVYFGDFGGTVWKLDADSGQVIWSHSVPDYTGNPGDYARTSPSLAGNTLVVGVIPGSTSAANPTNMLGIDAATGELRWKAQIHPDPHAAMTGSPVLVGDMVITGISANGASGGPGGANAIFRGAIVALNAQTGQILWRTYSVPDNGGLPGGYAGATMFSPPAVDVANGLVYGTFGQPYHEPASVAACNAAAPGGFAESCEQPGAYWKSIVAFDLHTGAVRWSHRMNRPHPGGVCSTLPQSPSWCPAPTDDEKWDLGGSGANVMRLWINHRWRDVVGIGAKSGVYTVLDAKTGGFIWDTLVGPGGDQGGVEWGTAFDGERIYVPITNQHHIPYQLTKRGRLTNTMVTGGSWAALDATTGTILWQTADPQEEVLPTGTVGVWDLAPVSVANGVMYGASMAKSGNQMYLLDAENGTILWQFEAGSSVNAGPAIVDGSAYWGSGYGRSAEGNGNTKFYAFSIHGH
ncbi:MAG TPA: PQQ-binding-like beta-propeller repeat protein [Vicinamibacterales bacterium]|jgi:polyvinyl alcohol dehydrogenase (cytochrome)